MPKRNKQYRRPADINQLAHQLVNESTGESVVPPPTREQISAFMAELGRKGGKIGGKRRLKTLSPEERTRIARKAARKRWSNTQ